MATAIENATKAALSELLRLYDWRFELAKMEAAVKAGNFLLAPEVKRLLRQYGEEKKSAWAVAREVLRGGETAIRGSQSSREHSEGEIPSPATNAALGAMCAGMHNLVQNGSAGCQHEWRGPGDMPRRYTCGCGTVVFRSILDAD